MLSLLLHGWKSWKREKGLAVLAIIALSVGIGCATAIFTVANTVLLKPLPYREGGRWLALFSGDKDDPNHYGGLSFADLQAFKERTRSFDIFGWFPVGGDFNLTAPGQPRHLDGIDVSADLLAGLGARPVAGRIFTVSDGPNVAVLSHRLYRQLGPDIIGKSITLNEQSYTVVGAMPGWFRLPYVSIYGVNAGNDVWLPLRRPIDEDHLKNYSFYMGYARLKPGITLRQASSDAARVAAQIRKDSHPNNPGFTSALFSLQNTVDRTIRPILLALLAAAGLLLLITCADVAGLLVSRAVARARETAIRVALGGSRRQLALQYFSESLVVSLAAAAGGLLASVLIVRLIVSFAADYIPRSDEVATSWPVILFAVAVALVTATLASLAPLWQAMHTEPREVLSNGVRASAGIRTRKLSQGLVIAEVALAFTLIAAGALLFWHLRRLTQTPPGFELSGLVTFQLTRANNKDNDSKALAAYNARILDALEATPGITDAASANQLPLAGCCFGTTIFPEGRVYHGEPGKSVSWNIVSADYFKTMRIPLIAGRYLKQNDDKEKPLNVVVDQDAAKRYFPGRDAVGQYAHFNSPNGDRMQVVGIVGTVRNRGVEEEPAAQLYMLDKLAAQPSSKIVVRSTLSLRAIASAIRRAVARVDAGQPVYDLKSMATIFSDSLIFQRMESIVTTFFAAAALLMACLGIYGLMSYSVRQRTAELGTRMAVGATGTDVLRLVVGAGARLSLYGILTGAVAVAFATWLLVHYLGIRHISPEPYVFSVAVVLLLASAASFFPAWRASLLSPTVAIRNESDSIWRSARRTFGELRERVAAEKAAAPVDASLLTELVEASRRAKTVTEALEASLEHLRQRLGAESALLLEKRGSGDFHLVARLPTAGTNVPRLPARGFLLSRLRFYSAPLSFSSADLQTSLRWAREHRPEYVAELDWLTGFDLRLGALLRTREDVIGLLLFGKPSGEDAYDLPERNLVKACSEQFALVIENGRLTERVLEQEKVRNDLALAIEVQKRLLPETSPQSAASSLDAFTLAARSVGGDYYDFLQVGDRKLGIALADVAGKGIAAALIMAVVQASLRIIASEGNVSLPELAARMNRFLHQSTGTSSYATFFYAQVDEAAGQLRYVNAGHNPPYLVRRMSAAGENGDAHIEELGTGGMIIGMFPAASYEESVLDLHAGDVLLAFTDGVPEALNASEEEFGETRLKELMKRLAHLPVNEMTSGIATALREWVGTRRSTTILLS